MSGKLATVMVINVEVMITIPTGTLRQLYSLHSLFNLPYSTLHGLLHLREGVGDFGEDVDDLTPIHSELALRV